MLRRVLVAVAVVILIGAFTLSLQINAGRSSDAASRHKRAAQELPVPFSGATDASDSTSDTNVTTETTTTSTTTICPEPSLNVSLAPNSSSIYVSWVFPNTCGTLERFKVSWGDPQGGIEDSILSNVTAYTIQGLDPCMDYWVKVVAEGTHGPVEGNNTATTTVAVPSSVSNQTVDEINARNLTLSWTAPETACNLSYTVAYSGKADWGENPVKSDSIATNAESVLLEDLQPFSNYNICVTATTDAGNSNETCTTAKTKEDVPSEPTNLNVDNSTETSILVTWEEPQEHNGILLQYSVTWWDGEADNGSAATNDTLYNIKDLISCVNYTVTVTASTSIGDGACGKTSKTTADEIPPEVDELRASEVAAETLTLSWNSPNTKCGVISYTITYNGRAQWGDNKTHSDSETVVTETMRLNGLTPFSKYEVCVAANTSAGQGDTSCIVAQTEEEEPSEPQNLQLSPTNNSIVVNWDKPSEENGVLQNYTISWFSDGDVNGSDYAEASEHTIANLPACVNLTVSVAASTSVGSGPESDNTTRTLVEVPPLVDDVEVSDVSARNLNLSWSSPETYCDVTNYIITYNGTAQWGNNETHSNSTTVETETLSLDGLTPFSKYTVCVAANTSAGQGISNCTETLTEEDAPSEPTNLKVWDLKAKKASITWDPPSDLNGDLTNYTVSVFDSLNSTVGASVTILAGGQRSQSFTDLEPKSIYTFQVEACTNAGCSYASTPSTTPKSWAALIVSLSVAVVLIALAALIFVKRDALRSALKTDKPEKTKSERSSKFQRSPINKVEDAAVKKHHIAQCIEELKSNEGSALQAEFEQMDKKSHTGTMNIATSPANYQKNRYVNILPFDDNIVYLESRTDNYVNASLVQDFEGKDLFIAAQGPMETTVTQFWQLVWEQNVENIVMLANCVESGKEKCAEYWPLLRQTKVLSQHFKIVNCSEEFNESFVVRTLEIRNKQSSRFVKQFHYTVWPDFGVPDDVASILDLMSSVKKSFVSSATEADRHILVHCSAGVGRTGTFIGVWNLCHRDLNEHSIDINVMKEVLDMRDKRVMMVQTPDQYLMLYKCFLEYNNNVTRWPLPETDGPIESTYDNLTEDAHGNTSQQEPIYENTRLHQEESIYENTNPRQQESIYQNWDPRQQGPHYKNMSTPQAERYSNGSPRRQVSSSRNRSPEQEDGIYENDGPPQPPRPQRGYNLTG